MREYWLYNPVGYYPSTGVTYPSSTINFKVKEQQVALTLNPADVNFQFVQQHIDFTVSSREVNFAFCENSLVFRLGTGNNHWDIGVHTHTESDITDLDKYTKIQVDIKDAAIQADINSHIADIANPHNVQALQVSFNKFIKNKLNSNDTQGAIDELIDLSYIIEYGAKATEDVGDGTIEGDVNATNWTGHNYAVGSALFIEENHSVTFGNGKDIAYKWVGPKLIKLGITGDYVATVDDFQALGTSDHTILINRDLPDAHPMAAITGLLTDQARQDTALSDYQDLITIEQARQDQDLVDHAALTDNSHQVMHNQLSDVTADQHHNKSHTHDGADGSGSVSHADLTNTTPDDHHARQHDHADPLDGTISHPTIINRDTTDSHPISAITGLVDEQLRQDQDLIDHETHLNPHIRVAWKFPYAVGTQYQPLDMVKDGDWTMVANKVTVERAAPQPLGDPENILPDVPTWDTNSDSSTVLSGIRFQFIQAGWYQSMRVWVPTVGATITHRLVTIQVGGVAKIEPLTGLVAGEWNAIELAQKVIPSGTDVSVFIESINSGSETSWQYPWTYIGKSNTLTPLAGEWNENVQRTLLRINKEDGDTTDHTLELQLVVNTEITITDLSDPDSYVAYRITGAYTELADHYTYPVVVIDTGVTSPENADGCQIRAIQPVPQATAYVETLDHWTLNQPDWATITGELRYDDVVQPGKDQSAFGIDIQFQKASISPDWNLLAFSGASSGGSSGGGLEEHALNYHSDVDAPVPAQNDVLTWDGSNWINAASSGGVSTFIELTDTPADYSGQAGKLVKVDPTGTFLIFGDPSGATVSWGDIQGTLATQTDLQLELDGKSDVGHAHAHADTTGITSDDHHPQTHIHDGIDGSGQIDYSDILNPPSIPSAQTFLHEDLTDITPDQHHAQAHTHEGDGSGTIPMWEHIRPLANGATIDDTAQFITESAGTVYLNFEQKGGGDVTFLMQGTEFVLDCTPAAQVALIVGTDDDPVLNYVYVTESGGVLTLTASLFWVRDEDFAPIATVLVQSTSSVSLYGVYKHHAWTDHIQSSTKIGHLAHINSKIRDTHATWVSGVAASPLIISSPDAHFTTSVGEVYQLHLHAMPARDMSVDGVYVTNEPTNPNLRITSFDEITQLADGSGINNRWFSLVVWAVSSENEADCKLFINLPTGSYSRQSDAEKDAGNYSKYVIPIAYRGTGFLVANYIVQGKDNGTWVGSAPIDLRGLLPAISPGAGTSTTDHAGLSGILPDDHHPQLHDIESHSDVTLTGITSGQTLEWNGAIWINATPSSGGGGGSMTVSDTPPAAPSNGDMWLDSKTGLAATWYEDGDSGQWISDPYKAEEVATAFLTSINGDTGPDVTLVAADVGAAESTHNHDGSYALISHAHIIGDVTGLQSALDGKSASDHNHTGTYEPASANIQTHIGIVAGNPHGTTAADVGAEVANANIQTHIGTTTGNPHSVSLSDVGGEPANSNIQTHIGTTTGNPHNVVLSDVGGEPANANIQNHISATGNTHGLVASDISAPTTNTAGLVFEVVVALPGTPDPDTLYIVTG